MSRNIRLFPTYSQKENQTTNHCLLILKMLYEENPRFLSEVLSGLISDNFSGAVGVQFAQQKPGKGGVPDGEITQEPFSILIETKLGSDFNRKQLRAHLKTLKDKQGQRVLIALGNFEQDIPSHRDFPKIECLAKHKYNVYFVAISFEDFFRAIKLDYLPKNLADAVSDLGEYFDENGLLPSWKYRLDVVNCKMSFDNVLQNKVYTCPAQGGQYNHRRSLYFGAYKNKCVEQVARIEAVVDLVSESESEANSVVWKNNSQPEEELINTAIKCYQKTGDSSYPMRVFILGDFFPTYFSKTSSGGMFGSKKYFDIEKLKVADAEDLAAKLKGKTWENYESLAI